MCMRDNSAEITWTNAVFKNCKYNMVYTHGVVDPHYPLRSYSVTMKIRITGPITSADLVAAPTFRTFFRQTLTESSKSSYFVFFRIVVNSELIFSVTIQQFYIHSLESTYCRSNFHSSLSDVLRIF